MASGKELLQKNSKNGGMLFFKITIFVLSLVKILAPFGSLFGAYSISYAFAIMYDDAVASKWGAIIVIALGVVLLAWIIAPILVLFNSRKVSTIGIISIEVLNLLDMGCCIASYAMWESTIKIINIIFSAFMILVLNFLLWKIKKTGDGFA